MMYVYAQDGSWRCSDCGDEELGGLPHDALVEEIRWHLAAGTCTRLTIIVAESAV